MRSQSDQKPFPIYQIIRHLIDVLCYNGVSSCNTLGGCSRPSRNRPRAWQLLEVAAKPMVPSHPHSVVCWATNRVVSMSRVFHWSDWDVSLDGLSHAAAPPFFQLPSVLHFSRTLLFLATFPASSAPRSQRDWIQMHCIDTEQGRASKVKLRLHFWYSISGNGYRPIRRLQSFPLALF